MQLYPTLFWEFAAGTLAGLSVAIGLVVIAATTVRLRLAETQKPAQL